MVSVKTKGSFTKTINFLQERKYEKIHRILDLYGRIGVEKLKEATPIDTGLTAESWYYEITVQKGHSTLTFNNTNIVNNFPIALLIQYGHGTKNGGYVQGIDYINPALEPIFKALAKSVWREVSKA